MPEQIRNVYVRIEVDTNKATYTFERRDIPLDEVEDAVHEFIEGLRDE